jgi:molybdopterin-guanine dinucleotide biosynthesis protein A
LSLVLNHADAALGDAMGFVLAGGRSSRMGVDKALVEFNGHPLVAHALRILREAGLPAGIAGARSALDRFAPVVEDREADRGPLAGICAALAATSARFAVFISVDSPLLPPSVLTWLLNSARSSGAAVTLATLRGVARTFPAVVDRLTLPFLEEKLAAGDGGCFFAFEAACASLGRTLDVLSLRDAFEHGKVAHPEELPLNLWFRNLNTPEDLEQARDRQTGDFA